MSRRSRARARLVQSVFPSFSRPLLQIVAAASLAGVAHAAPVLPTGGNVASGTATIGAPSNGALTVNQSSSKAIVNWNSFSIGQGGTVTFNNGAGATLNRVTGTATSAINGNLNATGSVYVINRNGIIVGSTGVVKVGGNFVASTLDASDAQFNAGGSLTLSGNSTAAVVNYGKIGSLGGDVALIAQTATNNGAISAPQGSAGVLAGTQVTLSDSTLNSGKFSVDVGNASDTATNSGTGTIAAAEAELKANGGNVYALAGNTGGTIAATGVASNDGKVFLTAGDSGAVTANATITAKTSTGAGGTVDTSGGTVNYNGIHVTAGEWDVDPVTLTVNASQASTLSTNLGTTNIKLQTTATTASGIGTQSSGAGDIVINGSIRWSGTHKLTLSAYHDVDIDANITATSGGNINLKAGTSANGTGSVNFAAGDKVSSSGKIAIYYNPASYTAPTDYSGDVAGGGQFTAFMLINNVTDLQNVNQNLAGDYALAGNIDASATSTWNSGHGFKPLGNGIAPFIGILNGQNFTIDSLTINSPTRNDQGLFGYIGQSGVVSSLSMTNESIAGASSVGGIAAISTGLIDTVSVAGTIAGSSNVGGVVGFLTGSSGHTATLSNAVSSANVSDNGAGSDANFGGVVGYDDQFATVDNAFFSAQVTADQNGDNGVGGVAGENDGLVENSATSSNTAVEAIALSGDDIGGLVGNNQGTVQDSSSAGTVSASESSSTAVGGLVGGNEISASQILRSSSTATVDGDGNVGGLVGENWGLVSQSNAGPSGCGCGTTPVTVTGSANVGGLVGVNESDIEKSNATDYVSAEIGGTLTAGGGLVGLNDAGAIINQSQATGFVTGTTRLGGLVGDNESTITQASADGDAVGTGDDVGGLIGYQGATGTITFGLAGGTADGNYYVGGLVGYNNGGSITDSGAQGNVGGSSTAFDVGGLVGSNANDTTTTGNIGTITGSYATGDVQGNTAGGLVGDNSGTVTESWAGGNVTGTGNGTGGLVGVGEAGGTITYAYAIGGVSATSGPVGGLVGDDSGDITYTYASGKVVGTAGGLIGYFNSGTLSNSYWDSFTTGQANPVGATGSGGTNNVFSVRADDGTAYTQASYSAFDFGTQWFMADGSTRPFLQSEAWSVGTNQYVITNSHQLQLIAMNPAATYMLPQPDFIIGAGDTEASASAPSANMWAATGFVPIVGFSGSLNGLHSSIDGLYINSTSDAVGLFSTIAPTGVVKNLALSGVAIAGNNDVGAFAGDNYGTLSGDFADGDVVGLTNVGGLAGVNELHAEINALPANANPDGFDVPTESGANVNGTTDVGGLVGLNQGDITGSDTTGGTITETTGSVGGTLGGLVGENQGTISNAFASDTVTGNDGAFAGGFVGFVASGASVTTSYATGNVTAGISSVAGGFAAALGVGSASVTQSYASGNVTTLDASTAGGFVGNVNAGAQIADAYALGSVSVGATATGGGFAGYNNGTIQYAYASGGDHGVVTTGAAATLGGFAGQNDVSGSIQNVYFDSDTTLQTQGIGADTGSSTNVNAVGEATTGIDAYAPASYPNLNTGADAGKWLFVAGARPMLAMEYSTAITNAHQLQLIATAPNASYTLADNVDAANTSPCGCGSTDDVWSSAGFVPIANFGGALEGNGFSIGYLYEGLPVTNDVGLFANTLSTAKISDLTMFNVEVTGANDVGVIAGVNGGQILNSAVVLSGANGTDDVGAIVGTNLAGGVVGGNAPSVNFGSTFIDGINGGVVAFADSVTGSAYVGGVVGWNQGSSNNAQFLGSVLGTTFAVGGIAGGNDTTGTIGNAQVSSNCSGCEVGGSASAIGGIAGVNYGELTGEGTNFTAGVSGPSTIVVGDGTSGSIIGGLVGRNYGDVQFGNVDAVVTGLNQSGGLIGYNTGTMENVTGSGSVNGTTKAGGAIGENAGTVQNVSVNVAVNGTQFVGGFAGQNDAASITGSLAHGTVTASISAAGGFVGQTLTGSQIDHDQAQGAVDGATLAMGGFAGINVGEMSNDSASGQVGDSLTAAGNVGGFVGHNYGTISASSATGAVFGTNATGGFAGYANGTLTDDTAGGNVTGQTKTGGFVGENAGTISGTVTGSGVTATSTTTAGGTVSGTQYVGGFVGQNDGDPITGAMSTGAVTGTTNGVGGFAGINTAGGTLSGDIETGGVTGATSDMGGFAGINVNAMSNDFASGAVGNNTTAAQIGGLVGRNNGTIDGSSSQSVVNGGDQTGGLVGYNAGTLTNSTFLVLGTVTGTTKAGGAIGENAGTTVSGDTVLGSVTGTQYVGGFVGWNDASTITTSTSSGAVSASLNGVGGFAGYNIAGGALNNDSSSSVITGTASGMGGFAGVNAGSLSGDAATGAVGTVADGGNIGGLVGNNTGTITLSKATGTVTGNNETGGLVGFNASGASVTKSYATGNVVGLTKTGGFAGENDGTLTNVYATGSVAGTKTVGGLIGWNQGAVTLSYAAGPVTGTTSVAGFAGINVNGTGTFANDYFDTAVTGQAHAVSNGSSGIGPMGSPGQPSPFVQSTYVGFDFTNVWTITTGHRPTLRNTP